MHLSMWRLYIYIQKITTIGNETDRPMFETQCDRAALDTMPIFPAVFLNNVAWHGKEGTEGAKVKTRTNGFGRLRPY